ncbi:thiamine pyrophosphate-binding protein [Microbacterium faecale]|uniref:thiamine pyrophosphate-binding protein n=1 Tax=Microbacterium faecale TaxID=1804630 RepID=UPI001E52B71E
MTAEGVSFVAARHEMGATCMADAYARATGRLAVVSVHQGCGLSNALTGVGEAAKSRTRPCLPIASRNTSDALRVTPPGGSRARPVRPRDEHSDAQARRMRSVSPGASCWK